MTTGGKRHRFRGAGAVLTALLLLTAGALFWSNCVLQVESFSFSSPRLPDDFDGYRLAVLSDLHGASFGKDNRRLLRAVAAQKPDAIAAAGDLVDRFRGVDWAELKTLADGLSAIAPVYYVTGNHEWATGDAAKIKALLTAAGWTVLSNESAAVRRGGGELVLAGIDDPNGYADQKTPETVAAEVHARYGDPFWILLAHRNDRFETRYSLLGADLTVSGHGHGGMIRLPGTDGLIGTRRDWFPSYTAGFYRANGHTVFVSRGLGNSGPSFRLFNRPQVAVLTLKKG